MYSKLVILALLGVSLPDARGLPLKELQAEKQRIAKLLATEENYEKSLQNYVSESNEDAVSEAQTK